VNTARTHDHMRSIPIVGIVRTVIYSLKAKTDDV
jgi:hypothetical protein